MKIQFLVLALLASLGASGQCGFDAVYQARLQQDSRYKSAVQAFDESWMRYASLSHSQQKMLISGVDTTYEIPLVLHVIHNGEPLGSANNPPDTQLISLVNFVNATFEASWPSYPSPSTGGVRTHIRFVLAHTDSTCHATSGIERINGSSVPGYTAYGVHPLGVSGPGADDLDIRQLSVWNWNDYMNVWIVHKLDGMGSSVAYAQLPTQAGPSPDLFAGVMMIGGFNAKAGLTTILTHELGHCLGLYHTFEGDNGGSNCPPIANCATTGDLICDTEPDKRSPACSTAINPCTNMAYAGVAHNYMNYTDCTDRFTAGQRDRMLYYLKTFWDGLRYSRAGDTVGVQTLVPTTCIPTFATPGSNSSDGPVIVSFNGIYRRSHGYADDGRRVYVDNSCNYRTQVAPGFTYPLTVYIAGSVQNIKMYLDLNNDGIFQLPGEEMYSVKAAKGIDTIRANIRIPATGIVQNKPLRMRIVCDAAANTGIGPCGLLSSGQAEDYGVTITKSAGVNSVNTGTPTIYPNPASDFLMVESTTGSTATIFTMVGQQIFTTIITTEKQSIPIVKLLPGAYLLRIVSKDGISSIVHFVKE